MARVKAAGMPEMAFTMSTSVQLTRKRGAGLAAAVRASWSRYWLSRHSYTHLA